MKTFTKEEIAIINQRRAELEREMDGEVATIHNTEKHARLTLGTNAVNANTMGRGHRSIGAKNHGYKSIPCAGAGASWQAVRLHRAG